MTTNHVPWGTARCLALAALLLNVGTCTGSDLACPLRWRARGGACVRHFMWRRASFWRAEAVCRGEGGTLVEVRDSDNVAADLSDDPLAPSGLVWVGARYEQGAWLWNNGVASTPSQSEHLNGLVGTGRCLAVDTTPARPQLMRRECGERLPFVCARGRRGCVWSDVALDIEGASFVRRLGDGTVGYTNHSVRIAPGTNIVSIDRAERGIGRWETSSTFRLDNPRIPGSVDCSWRAVFSHDTAADVPMVVTGCVGHDGVPGVFAAPPPCRSGPATSYFADDTNARVQTDNLWDFSGAEGDAGDEGSSGVSVEFAVSVIVPFLVAFCFVGLAGMGIASRRKAKTLRDATAQARGNEEAGNDGHSGHRNETESASGSGTGSGSSGTCGTAGTMRSAQRSMMTGTSSSTSSLGTDASALSGGSSGDARRDKSNPADRECILCTRSFDAKSAKRRLHGVYAYLSEQLSKPFVVHSAACYNHGGEHRHMFDVANELDSHVLGYISTAYLFSKPRPPRNTRAYIRTTTQNEEGEEDSSATDLMYHMDAYY